VAFCDEKYLGAAKPGGDGCRRKLALCVQSAEHLPALGPLFDGDVAGDVIIVQINPIHRDQIPRTPLEINNRVNEITFNASLLAELSELRAVAKSLRRADLRMRIVSTASAAPAASSACRRTLSSTCPGASRKSCVTSAALARRIGLLRISTRSASIQLSIC
jgi:hypothetical protein